jgi:putative oxidoreductase
MTGLGLAVLRLTLAVVFVAHGAHELFGVWAGPGVGPGGVQTSAAHFSALGLHPEMLIAVAAGLVQLVGGALLGIGWLARWASIALIAYLSIGVWKEQLKWGLFLNWTGTANQGHGLEYSLAIGGALVCLVLAGAGEWSIDGLRARSASSRAAGRARLRGKV